MEATLADMYGVVPVTKDVLASTLESYKAPRSRIALLERKGELIRLRRDLYACRPARGKDIHPELIANSLVSPSYISYETVLAWEGYIPERVYTIRSACLGRSRTFQNETGNYTYTTVPLAYFPIGVTTGRTAEGHGYRMARPEKALCDVIADTAHLRIQSERAMYRYLEQDLRFDTSRLHELNPDIIRECAETCNKKKRELNILHHLIDHERV